jgi:hypothetical protein
MTFDGDAFISYAHLDNVELVEGRKGWVANLHRALEIRVAQLIGKDSRIWWDPKLQGNDYFAETLVDRLQRVAALVSVVSPRYVKSDWGRKEIVAFCKAAEHQGGVRVGDKARLFKVLKTPVPRDQHPTELQNVIGYEFFKVEADTGRVREFSEVFGPEAQRDFWIKLDDLAHDLCCLLEVLEPGQTAALNAPVTPSTSTEGAIYLALTTNDLKEQREAIKRDLEQHGYVVLPDQPLPIAFSELQTAVRASLARCRMSIHLIGKTYSLVPEGCTTSLTEIQNDLAIERTPAGSFSRLLWIPPGLVVDDERQRRLVEQLRMDPRSLGGTDLLETPIEDLLTMIAAWLKQGTKPARPAPSAPPANVEQVYLLYDRRDQSSVAPWAEFLFKEFEVIHPVFDGDEADVREYHEDNLRNCDGVLIFYGAANECWIRRKLRELQKSAGYGRTKPAPVVGVLLIAPRTPDKERFCTHEAIVVPQWDGFSPDPLLRFVSRLNADSDPGQGDAAARSV